MKIFHIDSEKTFRGGQQQILYLLEGLRELNVENILACPACSPLFNRAGKTKKIPVAMRSEFDIFSAIKIAKTIRKEKPQIIHCHSAHALSIGIMSKKFSGARAHIVAARRVDFHIKSRRKYFLADRIIAVSQAVREVLRADGIPDEKIKVVYDGIDMERFADISCDYLYREFEIGKNQVIGNVAALTQQKDHFTLIRAIPYILKKNREVRFFIVGEGCLRRAVEKLSKKLGISEYIFFTGFREDVINFFPLFDIFVLTSRWEGLGTSILDAMASDVPVVATSVGGIPEIVKDGFNGLLVPSENYEHLAEKISLLIKNKNMREELSKKGKETVKRFGREKMVLGTRDVYKELISEKNSGYSD